MHRTVLRGGIATLLAMASLVTASNGLAQTPGGNSGIIVPASARAVLSQAELVEGVCLMSRWRAEELFTAVDAVAAKQPAAQAALEQAGITYQLPNPETYRGHANNTLDAICAAPTVDQAMSLVDGLLQVNADMEAAYGALSEAIGGRVDAVIDAREKKIRVDVELFVEPQRKQAEESLDAEAQQLADGIAAEVKPAYDADITTYAQNLAKSYTLPQQAAAFSAALQPYIDAKVAEAKAAVTAQVEAALAVRISAAESKIRAEADAFAETLGAALESDIEAVQTAFDAMLSEVERRTAAAKVANSPAKRAAVEKRVQLALKAVDSYLNKARNSIDLARTDLAALHAAEPGAPDADQLIARLNASRTQLESDLRAAANTDNEVQFNAAYAGFEAAWREASADVDRATGTWTAARVCQTADRPLADGKTQAQTALEQVQAAQHSLSTAPADQGIQAFRNALDTTAEALDSLLGEIASAQEACVSPSGPTQALIAELDATRQAYESAQQAYESARQIEQSLGR